MHTLIVLVGGKSPGLSVHVFSEEGPRVHTAPTVHGALSWLWLQGERQVVAYTDDGPELFLLEPCDHTAMVLPALSLRRSHLGGCCDLPKLRGLDPALADRVEVLEKRPETTLETRRRRKKTLRGATFLAGHDDPG